VDPLDPVVPLGHVNPLDVEVDGRAPPVPGEPPPLPVDGWPEALVPVPLPPPQEAAAAIAAAQATSPMIPVLCMSITSARVE
jgi:hypothetical protein